MMTFVDQARFLLFFGLFALLGLQFALFHIVTHLKDDYKSGVPRESTDIVTHLKDDYVPRESTVSPRTPSSEFQFYKVVDQFNGQNDTASACILVCDDNHFLIGK
jgi:hypothetical protein